MNQPNAQATAAEPKKPEHTSELRQFAKLLDEFFAKIRL
jgi:hypothetical protein